MRQARCDGGYCFELTVKAPAITFVRFSGAPLGGYLACDELRITAMQQKP